MNDTPSDRDIGRAKSYDFQSAAEARGEPLAWFDELYRDAGANRERIPWSDAAPRQQLADWLAANPGDGRRAIDVGCGLGDNAEMIAKAGYNTTAFDISKAAVTWARKNHAETDINFETADIFNLPDHWAGAFDLVHETYNLQALPQDRVGDALIAIAALVAPDGKLLIMTRIRQPDEQPKGPPWPLLETDLMPLQTAGLTQTHSEHFQHGNSRILPHVLTLYERLA